jgi:Nuclease-related domain
MRRNALRRNWRDVGILAALFVASAVAIVALDGLLQLVGAFILGMSLMLAAIIWIMGGDVWSLPPAWGAIGEEQTGDVLEGPDSAWWVEHDIPYGYGNYDHIVVGPPGVFLLDTKRLSRTALVRKDELRAGGMRYSGTGFRRAAVTLAEALGSTLGARPWVQSVVVVWGTLGHETREEDRVVYVQGENLLGWLQSQPVRAQRERCAEFVRAVASLRERSAPDRSL